MDQTSVTGIEAGKRVAWNMICSTAAHMLSAAIAFVLTPFLVTRIGLEAYGFYPIAAELSAFFGLFCGLINATATRYITVEEARGAGEEAAAYFSTVFYANVLLCGILAVPMGLFVAFAPSILSIPAALLGELRAFFAMTLGSVLIGALTSAFSATYSVTNRLDLRASQELIAGLLKAAILLALLGGGLTHSIVGVGVAVLISTLAEGVVAVLMCRRLTPELTPSLRRVSRPHAARVLASGLWYTLDRCGAFLMTGSLLLLANLLFTSEGVGVYSVSLTASRALYGVLLMVAGIFMPLAAKRFARGEEESLRADIVRDQRVTGLFAAVGVAMACGFCHEFFTLWLGDSSPLLRILTVISVAPTVVIATALPIVNLGLVMNRLRRLSLLFVAAGLLTPALALLLACFTPLGVTGVAIASAAAQLGWYGIVVPLYAARLLGARPIRFFLPVLRSLLAAGLSLFLILAIKQATRIVGWPELILIGGACLAVTLLVSFLVMFGKPKIKF